jgi:hypothetical protein
MPEKFKLGHYLPWSNGDLWTCTWGKRPPGSLPTSVTCCGYSVCLV